jgi:hypothetical protein
VVSTTWDARTDAALLAVCGELTEAYGGRLPAGKVIRIIARCKHEVLRVMDSRFMQIPPSDFAAVVRDLSVHRLELALEQELTDVGA